MESLGTFFSLCGCVCGCVSVCLSHVYIFCSMEGCIELAFVMGLIKYHNGPLPGGVQHTGISSFHSCFTSALLFLALSISLSLSLSLCLSLSLSLSFVSFCLALSLLTRYIGWV